MGYYTDFKLTMQTKKLPLTEQPVVQDIVAFMQRKGLDFDENSAARLVTELAKHFKPLEVDEDTILERLDTISGYEFSDSGYLSSSKWYEHEANMEQLSAEFPTVTFVLDGNGEESGDVWKKTFVAGKKLKTQVAKMVFEEE